VETAGAAVRAVRGLSGGRLAIGLIKPG
jgi:hypothetical protein